MGHEAAILTAVPFGEEGPGKLYSGYEYDGLKVHCIDLNLMPHSRFKDTYYRPELYPILRDIVSSINPDIVHVTHLINHTATLLEVLRDLTLPTVATLTDFFGICFNNRLEYFDGSLCRGPNRRSTNCLYCYLNTVRLFSSNALVGPLMRNGVGLRFLSQLLYHVTKIPGVRASHLAGHVSDVTQRQKTLRYLYRNYRTMVAPTDFLYEAYASNNVYPARLKKINFGIDLDLVKDYQNVRDKTDQTIRFGYIGQIAPHKGVDLLVQAFVNLSGDNKTLVIYGPQDQDLQYVAEIERIASGSQNVSFRGTFPSEELPQRLSNIDVLVIPSRWYENSPLVLLYALATKTPVIVSDVKGMTEFIKEDYNGFTFRLNSLRHLTTVMQDLVDNPHTIQRLSQNAAYTMDVANHAAEVLNIYEEVLEDPGRPSKG
jgi:glycosyltransferase involved in cell wall biosynthesis